MFKRPSSRRKTSQEGININLVPFMDALVTLIGFLLFGMAFLALTHVESSFPETSAEQVQEKLKEKPLQLTISLRENEVEIWSPFDKVEAKKIPHTPEGKPDFKTIHDTLLTVKKDFPAERKIVIAPHAQTNYDTLIAVMDSIRLIEATDPPLFWKNPASGNDEQLKQLFPDVIFGNLLGDS